MKLRFLVGPTGVGAETLGLVGNQARFSPLTSDFGQRLTGPPTPFTARPGSDSRVHSVKEEGGRTYPFCSNP